MAALEDIMGTPTPESPSPLRGGGQPLKGGEEKKLALTPPITDATKLVPKPGEVPAQDLRRAKGGGGAAAEKPRMSYTDLYNALNPDQPETAEERAKREKREKQEAVLAAVGDGISALSNLWFTSQYAPNAYDPNKGFMATAKNRWDKLKAERDAHLREYREGYMRAAAMDQANEREDRNWRHTIEREKIADKRYEEKQKQEKALVDLNEQLKRHQITAAEHKAEQERIAAMFAGSTEALKQENLKAGIRQKQAAAGASSANAASSYSRARYYDNGGGKGKSGPTLQLEEDEPMRFGDSKDYDRTVMRLAREYNVPTSVTEVTEYDTLGNKKTPKKQRTVQRPVKDIAADIEREAAKRKKATAQAQASGKKWNNTSNIKW